MVERYCWHEHGVFLNCVRRLILNGSCAEPCWPVRGSPGRAGLAGRRQMRSLKLQNSYPSFPDF